MKIDKYTSSFLFFVFSSLGAYILHESLRDPGDYAEAGVLAGAMFSALSLAAFGWAVRQHLLTRAVRRHIRGHHS